MESLVWYLPPAMKFFNKRKFSFLIVLFFSISLMISCSTKKQIRIDASAFGRVEKFWLRADLKSLQEFKKFKILCFRSKSQWQLNFYSLTNVFLIELFLDEERCALAVNYRKKNFWSGFADSFYRRILKTSLTIEEIYQLLIDQKSQSFPSRLEAWKQSWKDGWLILENDIEKIRLRLKKEGSIVLNGQLKPPELNKLKRVELDEFIESL